MSIDSPHTWTRLSVTVPAEAEEAVTAAFLREDAAARATGLVIEDADAGILASGPPLARDEVRVCVYAPPGEADAVAATIVARLEALVPFGVLSRVPPVVRQDVADADWRDRWKEFFHVQRVGERLVVRPPWREHTPEPDDVVVTIEPGLAFGTGGHQTTQLCLRALERLVDPGAPPPRLLDVGCGSGVLAIAAVLLGTGRALAVDVDPLAVEATGENSERNGVTDRVTAGETPLAEIVARGERYPLVVANIISGTLLELRAELLAATGPGGVLIVSGLLADEEAAFRAAFAGEDVAGAGVGGLELVWRETMDEWLGLAWRTPAGPPSADPRR